MTARAAVPVLYPLVLPAGRPAPALDVDQTVRRFASAEQAYRDRRFAEAAGAFLAVAEQLLDTVAPAELAGARTICYFNAVLAGVAAGGTVDPVQSWVAQHDPVCVAPVAQFVAVIVPGVPPDGGQHRPESGIAPR